MGSTESKNTNTHFQMLTHETNYYKLLGSPTNASQDDLKKFYRKMALRLHPDRNHGHEEEATLLFAKVQAAYDILSDPQERAYYDAYGARGSANSRNGQTSSANSAPEPERPRFLSKEDILSYMNPDLFAPPSSKSWFSKPDAATNSEQQHHFFKTASDIFKRIAKDEEEATTKFDPLYEGYPTNFGTIISDFNDIVAPFYRKWSVFKTRKTFVWIEVYQTKYAEDRRTRRAMEQENKKAREAAKYEYNEAVRKVVNFIKQQDPRISKHGDDGSSDKKKKKKKAADNKEAKKASERDRKRNTEKLKQTVYEEQEWEKVSSGEDLFSDDEEVYYNGKKKSKSKKKKPTKSKQQQSKSTEQPENESESEEEDEEEGEEDEDVLELFECIVCDKTFETNKQLVSHEQSKKHLKNVEILKKEMMEEGVELGFDQDLGQDTTNTTKQKEEKQDSEQEEEEDISQQEHRKPTGFGALASDNESESDDEPDYKKPTGFAALASDSEEEEDDDDEPDYKKPTGFGALASENEDSSSDEEEDEQIHRKPTGFAALASDNEDEDDDDSSTNDEENNYSDDSSTSTKNKDETQEEQDKRADQAIEDLLAKLESLNTKSKSSAKKSSILSSDNEEEKDKQQQQKDSKKLGKAKQKKLKKQNDPSSSTNSCTICHQKFPTRNKLFQHISNTGHAALKR